MFEPDNFSTIYRTDTIQVFVSEVLKSRFWKLKEKSNIREQ